MDGDGFTGAFMITERGVVERIVKEKAVVRVQQSSSCASCEARGACNIENDKPILVEVRNDLQARVGDDVEISIPSRSLIKMGILVYLLPVLGLILGAYVGNAFSTPLDLDSNLASFLGGALALGVSFGVLKKIDRKAQKKPEYHPRMKRILISAVPSARIDDSK